MTLSATLLALYNVLIEAPNGWFTGINIPLTQAGLAAQVMTWNWLPGEGVNPLTLAMFSVPLRLAVPLTSIQSYVTPCVVPPSSTLVTALAPSTRFPVTSRWPGELPGRSVPFTVSVLPTPPTLNVPLPAIVPLALLISEVPLVLRVAPFDTVIVPSLAAKPLSCSVPPLTFTAPVVAFVNAMALIVVPVDILVMVPALLKLEAVPPRFCTVWLFCMLSVAPAWLLNAAALCIPRLLAPAQIRLP